MARDKGSRRGRGLSRRSFLKGGAAAGAMTTGLLPARLAEGAPSASQAILAEPVGPGKVPVSFEVNGEARQLELEPRVTLLDALRDHLDVTGPKKVCDRATCGACTVQRDGKLVYACTVLAIEAQGSKVTTVEGLGTPENMHPVQQAFVENDAQQCGFCTPGLIMASAALLEQTPEPTLEDIERGLGGNLCRCGTYAGIRGALTGHSGRTA